MEQAYLIPASPAPAEKRYGLPPETVRNRKNTTDETDILRSEYNCFSYKTLRYKKINPELRIDLYYFLSGSLCFSVELCVSSSIFFCYTEKHRGPQSYTEFYN
jgi:hypothetical protein